MTATFESIIEQKKTSILKVLEGLQELSGQPSLDFPPDSELRKCTSPELIYLIGLNEQVRTLTAHAIVTRDTLFNVNSRLQTTRETLHELGKLDDSKGGASFNW